MDGQLSFATLDYVGKKKRTKRDVFLAEMAAAVPWSVLEAVIAPHYPKEGPQGGRRAFPIAVMLRIYCLQQWYNLSDPGAEEALYDIQSMRAFCNLELGRDPIPDETKAHVGVDAISGLVHTAGVTSGNVHDAKLMDRLIRDDDTAVYGDKGYASGAKKRAAEAAGVRWAVKEKAKPGGRLTAPQRARNHRFGKVRAKVEHVFRVVKCQFGYRKVRYRGIAKNGAQVFSLLALANLYLARRKLASA